MPNSPPAMAMTPQPMAPVAATPVVSMAPPAAVMDAEIEKSIGKMSIETKNHTGEMTPTRKLFLKLTEQVSKIFIGQDELENIDEDTLYFIISTLNQLDADPLRNKILLKVLPLKV